MAFSTVGWVAAAFRARYSWGSLALSSALAWPTPSSNAALAALKYSADRRSKAADCVCARPRMASTPAWFVLASCSGVKVMIIYVGKKDCVQLTIRPANFAVPRYRSGLIALQHRRFYKDKHRCQE